MIEPRQVRARASKLYSDLKRRSAPKYWKNGKLKGRMRWPGVPVPYTSQEFADWLMVRVGVNAFLCPYCNAPIDVLSMVLDHGRALSMGGDNELSNLVPCCADCNILKGRMSIDDYLDFRLAMHELSTMAQVDVLQRLRSGAKAQRLQREIRAGKAKQKQVEEVF